MKRLILIFTVFLVAFQVAYAQNPDRRALGERLEMLNRKLVEIRGLALRYQSERAIELVSQAFEAYNSALTDLQASPPRLIRARGSFMRANNLANQAAKILLFKPAFRYRTELENMVQKAELAVHRNNTEDGRYFVNKARAFQNQANLAIGQGEFLRAQEYYRIAMYFAEKAFTVAEGLDEAAGQESFQEQVRNITALLNNLSAAGEMDPAVTELVEKVKLYMERARRLYEQNNAAQALVQLRISERFLYRAVDLQRSRGINGRDQIREDLYSLRRYIDAVENSLEGDQSARYARFLQKARQFYAEADEALNRNQPEQARQRINLAQRMAARAMQSHTGMPERSEENLTRRINEISRILQLQQEKIGAGDFSGIEILHEEANALLSSAARDLETGNTLRAYQKIQICLRLVNRIERMLDPSFEQTPDPPEIRKDIERIGTMLSRLRETPEAENRLLARLELLEKLLQRAVQLSDAGRYGYAQELLRLIQSQLDSLLNESFRQ